MAWTPWSSSPIDIFLLLPFSARWLTSWNGRHGIDPSPLLDYKEIREEIQVVIICWQGEEAAVDMDGAATSIRLWVVWVYDSIPSSWFLFSCHWSILSWWRFWRFLILILWLIVHCVTMLAIYIFLYKIRRYAVHWTWIRILKNRANEV